MSGQHEQDRDHDSRSHQAKGEPPPATGGDQPGSQHFESEPRENRHSQRGQEERPCGNTKPAQAGEQPVQDRKEPELPSRGKPDRQQDKGRPAPDPRPLRGTRARHSRQNQGNQTEGEYGFPVIVDAVKVGWPSQGPWREKLEQVHGMKLVIPGDHPSRERGAPR